MSPLLYLTLILALGVLAQWLAWRLKLPSILLLLAFGFALGQFTGVRIDDFLAPGDGHTSPLLSAVGLFVAIILFEGGLTLKFREYKEAGLPIFRLCTAAVALSFGLTTLFMVLLLGYDIRIAALIGSILTVTGPTVVGPLLRHVNPARRMASIVKWEGIIVDPIGAILAVVVFKIAIASDFTAARTETLRALALLLGTGIAGGILIAMAVEQLLKRHLVPDFLQPVFLLGVVALAFTGSNFVENEAGLLTVTVLGIALANQTSVSVRHILEFKENLGILIISGLFIVLSGRIDARDLAAAVPKGGLLLAFLILIGRPLSVFGALIGDKTTNLQERTFLAFLAPRGIVAAAVTAIFALEFEEAADHGRFGAGLSPLIATQARELVALVFLIIVGTVAVYGLASRPLARHLGLACRDSHGILFAGADPWVRAAAHSLHLEGHPVILLDTNYRNISAAKMLGMSAHRANILSEFAGEHLEFNGIGHLIAATPNDEVNSLATLRFAHQFTRARVWQTAPAEDSENSRKAAANELRARICFTRAPTHRDLARLAENGAVMKKSVLTDQFDFAQFQLTYPNAHILFIYDGKSLCPAPTAIDNLPPGTTLHALIPAGDLDPPATPRPSGAFISESSDPPRLP